MDRAQCNDTAILAAVPSIGRLDRKIEFPLPNEEARSHILRIHSRKMNVSQDVNFEELARSTDDFNGAQLKAVCVEAVRGKVMPRLSQAGHTQSNFVAGNCCQQQSCLVYDK